MKMSQVLSVVCKKRKIDETDYTLKLADTITDIPLDKTLQEINVTEVCLLKKDRGRSAGDIFLRPPDESNDDDSYQPSYISPSEYISIYKVNNVPICRNTALLERGHLEGRKEFWQLMESTSIFCQLKASNLSLRLQRPFPSTFHKYLRAFKARKLLQLLESQLM